VCENTDFTRATVLNWTGGSLRSIPIRGAWRPELSPDGNLVAFVDLGARATSVDGADRSLALLACGWLDNLHLLAGGDAQTQPRVADVTNGNIAPVAALGYCGGRIPGGL
ncbi:MAG: hypothetical protein M3R21_10780, partial [Candidatus Dormibacteraeota bacterium]|nr:hypothetical protein [Candidatus Dormibacteraeota bacterium]